MTQTHTGNRREDLRLISGRGRYSSDWNLPNQSYAAFLRSDRAHAEIAAVSVAAALKMPGVIGVFTGADAVAAGYTRFPNLLTFLNRHGNAILETARPVLAHGKTRFVGEPVAMVVGESALAAHDALEAIEIEYLDLAASVTTEDALADGAAQLHENVPGNLCFEWETGDASAVAQAFERAAHVTRVKVRSQRVVPTPMEPRACLVSYEAASDSYDIYAPSQGINILRWQFATLTGVPEEKLRLHLHDVGGSFGQRTAVYPEYAAQMIAARKLGRPVKWVGSRSEGFLADSHGRGITMCAELALDRDGKFLAARHDFVCDAGAYLTPNGPSGHLRNSSIGMSGVYRIPALYGVFKVVVTNAAPIAAYRGAGRPDIAYVIERLVDQAARELNIDRAELRRRNFIPVDAFPYKTPTGSVYEKADFAGCLAQALNIAKWGEFEKRREAARTAGKLRGIGISTVVEGTGAGRAPQEEVALEFDAHGRITIYTVTLSSGQGHETTFAAIVARTLGIPEDVVTLRESAFDKSITGNPSGGSRSLVATGSVCQLVAQKLIQHAQPLAAEALELEPSQLSYSAGVFRSSDGGKTIALDELARKLADTHPHPLNVTASGVIGATFPNGCHISEVDVDPQTGVTEIVAYTAVDDCGNVINHSIVEGQVHGGVAQGAGQVFGEQAVYDRDSGQLLAGSFSDYYMPHAGWIKEINLNERPVVSAANVLGAKGVGESGCTASLPTLVSAVLDALRPRGVEHLDMPLTPSKVWNAIQTANVNSAV